MFLSWARALAARTDLYMVYASSKIKKTTMTPLSVTLYLLYKGSFSSWLSQRKRKGEPREQITESRRRTESGDHVVQLLIA